MRGKLDTKQVLSRFSRIIGAAANGNTTHQQVAEALLEYFDRAEDQEGFVRLILAEFNIKKLGNTREFKFPERWSEPQWRTVTKKCKRTFPRFLADVTDTSDSRAEAAKMITGALKHLEGDERVVFMVAVLQDDFCPFNFYKQKGHLTAKDVNVLLVGHPAFRQLREVINGTSGRRFLTKIDEADFVFHLMTTLDNPKEMAAFITAMFHWFRLALERQKVVIEGDDDFATFLQGLHGRPAFPFMSDGMGSALRLTHPEAADIRDLLFGGIRAFRAAHGGEHGPQCHCESCEDQGRAPYRPHHPDQPENEGCHCDPAAGGVGHGCDPAAGPCRPSQEFYIPEGGKTC